MLIRVLIGRFDRVVVRLGALLSLAALVAVPTANAAATMRHRLSVYLLVPVLFALLAPPASALGFSILNGARIGVEAQYEETKTSYRPPFPRLAVPESRSLQAVAQGVYGGLGEARSNLTYSLSTSAWVFNLSQSLATSYPFGGCLPFDPFCSPQSAGGSNTIARADISFTPDANVGYSLSGFFNGSFFEGGGMQLVVVLCDNGTEGTLCGNYDDLFFSNQASNSTPNESFTLGTLGGDYISEQTGSLTGTLLANRMYTLSIWTSFGDQYAMNSIPSATGNVTLMFVPEPGTGMLVTAGVAALTASRRRRTR